MTQPEGHGRQAQLVRQWRDVLACYSRVSCDLDRRLQEEFGLGMSEFEALDRLIDAACEKLKMNQLAAEMYLSQSALSRTVARLEKQGLIERSMCANDRRSIFVKLTEEGRVVHERARELHRAILSEQLG
jgi:DNA-binding MarR family transcriptional regulator